MFYLRLFGSPTLELGDVALTGRPVQRHRIALLALLAMAPGRRATRDKLMAYLWPERSADNARNLLKQATYVLRAELGENALLSEGDELRLNEQVVLADAAEFDVALTQLDFVRATQLYRGPFMDGFFLSDAPEFEEWSARERQRLANAHAGALESLAAAAEAAGDWAGAAEWWKKRAAGEPFETRVAVRLVQALAASGSRATALQHAAIHERLLREEFALDAPAELTALVEQLRQQQERAPQDVPVPAREHERVPAAQPPGEAAQAHVGPPGRRWLRAAVPAGMLVLLAAVIWAATPRSADPAPSIVVLPFANLSGDSANEYFSDGLTEEVIAGLSSLDGLKVISRTSAMHYKGTRQPLREIARELNVAHVLEGSVRHVKGRVRITAQLIDAASDDHIWADHYELDLNDSFRVQEQIARAVAEVLEVKLRKGGTGQLARRGTHDPEAYQMYRRARWLWTQRTRASVAQAIRYFEGAIARDSNYSDAYAGLADAYIVSYQLGFGMSEDSARSRHKWAAERALALDDESAAAHAAAATSFKWDSNWPGAEREHKRAIELNPGDADARSMYAVLLYGMGRLEEAREQARRAYETDPYAIIVSIVYAYSMYLLKDYDAALAQWQKTLELDPAWTAATVQSAIAYSNQGRHQQALELAGSALQQSPNYSGTLADAAYVSARAGKMAEARELLRRARTDVFEPFHIGRAWVALGESDSAFVWLERSNWKWPHRAQLADPALDPIRGDPRFRELKAEVERTVGLR